MRWVHRHVWTYGLLVGVGLSCRSQGVSPPHAVAQTNVSTNQESTTATTLGPHVADGLQGGTPSQEVKIGTHASTGGSGESSHGDEGRRGEGPAGDEGRSEAAGGPSHPGEGEVEEPLHTGGGEPDTSHAEGTAPLSKPDCGWLPTGPTDRSTVYRADGGCGLAPEGPESWKSVREIRVVGLELRPSGSRAYVVFLDEHKRRVKPTGRTVAYEMVFRKRKRGKIPLRDRQQRDGVYELKLPGNRPSKPCTMHLFVRFNNGSKKLEEWLDDWQYLC